MHPTQVCIFARPMSRPSDRALPRTLVILAILLGSFGGLGCSEIDGRNRTRAGNRLFRETRFIDAVAEYEKALTSVQDPILNYNLGLAYSKVFKPGVDKAVRIGVAGSFACSVIPNTRPEKAQVCIKDGDRRYDDCDDKNVCASSYRCEMTELCTLEQQAAAGAAAENFQKWLAANAKDDDTRKLMTQVWIDSQQFERALEYWSKRLADAPRDTEIMGNLAGINLKAGDWRKSIEWYVKVAEASADDANKVAAYQFIGNVAWSKLNSRTLTNDDARELADKGIGALQQAAALNPKNPKLLGLQASIFNFRSLTQGASWAAAIDRASAQDLHKRSRVLALEAKKAQGEAAPAPSTPTPAPSPDPEKAGG